MMPNRKRWAPVGAVVTLVVLTSVLLVVIVRQRGQLSTLQDINEQRTRFCQAILSEVRTYHADLDRGSASMRAEAALRLRYFHLDHVVLTLCLGERHGIDLEKADGCWIRDGADACYREAARQLEDALTREWRH